MSTDDRYGLNGWARHAHISRNFGGRAGHHGLARPPTGAGHSPPIPCAALHRRPRQKGAATAAAPTASKEAGALRDAAGDAAGRIQFS